MGSLAEFPDMVRATFVNPETNDEGIYNVRFFIRGKPWIISIDDYLFTFEDNTGQTRLMYGFQSEDGRSVWGAILEKAWAKVKGNYLNSAWGFNQNGLRVLTGLPVFGYRAGMGDMNNMGAIWQMLEMADEKNFVKSIATAGQGDDSVANGCGIAMSHAYSLLAAFTMTDASGNDHRMLLIRNPWDVHGYSSTWNPDDPNWTDALVAQVPFGFDPRAASRQNGMYQTGLFVAPFEVIDGTCFEVLFVAHNREPDGFVDTWYDKFDAGSQVELYYYKPSTNDHDIYITAESYMFNTVP